MRHQALARVFAIVLAVMCFVMLAAGAGGVRNAFSDKKSDESALELLRSRISSAEELEALLAGAESYDELSEVLDETVEQHEEESAQHRTDLATYSATRGGTKMGADKLWEAKAQVESGRAQLEAGMKQLEQGEAAYAVYQSAAALSAQCGAYIGETAAGLAVFQAIANATEPAEIVRLMSTAQSDAEAAMPSRASYNDTKNAAMALLMQISALSGQSFDASQIPADINVTVNIADIPATSTQIGTAHAALSGLNAGLTAFMSASGMDAGTGATLAATRTQLEEAMKKLELGEGEIQGNLEQIWYQNGELEKDAAELEERKSALEAERESISELEQKTEQQKENERKYKSLSVLLKKNTNIEAAVEAGGDLIESAKTEADRFAVELRESFIMRLVLCGICILGAIAGLVGIPAAFEKVKSRVMLILPVVLCLACAAAAVALSFYMGRGALYSAIFTLPFAIIQLLVVTPKKAG